MQPDDETTLSILLNYDDENFSWIKMHTWNIHPDRKKETLMYAEKKFLTRWWTKKKQKLRRTLLSEFIWKATAMVITSRGYVPCRRFYKNDIEHFNLELKTCLKDVWTTKCSYWLKAEMHFWKNKLRRLEK